MDDLEKRARELQNSLLDLMDFLQTFDELIEKNKQLKEANRELRLAACPICDERLKDTD